VSNLYASNKRALGICDRCGFQYKLKELKSEVVKHTKNNLLVCKDCFDPPHPQDFLGEKPIYDPQSLRNPRPDSGEYAKLRRQTTPINSLTGTTFLGQIVVQTN